MLKNKLISSIQTLYGYCNNKNNWKPTFDDAPYDKMLQNAFNYYNDKRIWSFILFESYFNQKLIQLRTITQLSNTDIEQIVDDIEIELTTNITDNYIIFPLIGAQISNSVTIGNIHIVKTYNGSINFPNYLSETDIKNDTRNFTGLSSAKIEDGFFYAKQPSSGFLCYPLLIIKVRGQFTEVSEVTSLTSRLRIYLYFIRLIASKNNAQRNDLLNEIIKSNHYLCLTESNTYMRYPINDQVKANYNLDFLNEPKAQNNLIQLIKLYEEEIPNSLRTTFLKSLKFFNWGLDGKNYSNDDLSKRLLNFMISLESFLLFTTRGEKKSKLAAIASNLASGNKEENKSIVLEMYNKRSYLVHSADQDFTKYQIDFDASLTDKNSLQKFEEIVAEILLLFPAKYNEIKKSNNAPDYLNAWKAFTSSFIPVKTHSWIQNQIINLINWLKKKFNIEVE